MKYTETKYFTYYSLVILFFFCNSFKIIAFVPDFSVDKTDICVTNTVTFTDLSMDSPTAWTWSFAPSTVTYQNGTTANSTNPQVRFDAIGIYTVTLTTTTTAGMSTVTKNKLINVYGTSNSMPFTEGFTTSVPPPNWIIINPDNLEGWENVGITGPGGNQTQVARMDNYSYNAQGQLDDLVFPALDLSGYCNPILIFNVAYAAYGASNFEKLHIEYSTNCGESFAPTTYAKEHLELMTAPYATSGWAPSNPSEWRSDTLDLSNYVTGSTIFKFVQTAGYGNGLFIDDIRIQDNCIGCTDVNAHNYDPTALVDNGTCETCSDGIKNGDEIEIDCGGSLCEACPPPCATPIQNIDGMMMDSTEIFTETDTIISTASIMGTSNISYQGGKIVILKPGFQVANGSVFTASIIHCAPVVNIESPESQLIKFDNPNFSNDREQLKVFPNPFTDKINIQFVLGKRSPVSVAIYSITGRKLKDLMSHQEKDVGKHELVFVPDNLPPGIYFTKLVTDNGILTKQIVLIQ